MAAAGGKKRPADEPAKDWERTLEPVRKLAAKIQEVLPPPHSVAYEFLVPNDAPRKALRAITRRRGGLRQARPWRLCCATACAQAAQHGRVSVARNLAPECKMFALLKSAETISSSPARIQSRRRNHQIWATPISSRCAPPSALRPLASVRRKPITARLSALARAFYGCRYQTRPRNKFRRASKKSQLRPLLKCLKATACVILSPSAARVRFPVLPFPSSTAVAGLALLIPRAGRGVCSRQNKAHRCSHSRRILSPGIRQEDSQSTWRSWTGTISNTSR